jgi:hypothetical protein
MTSKRIIVGVGLVAAVGVVFAYWSGLLPPKSGVEGTIGAAQRYQSGQIADKDVVLQDQQLQALLQSDVFHKLQTDPAYEAGFRVIVGSKAFEEAAKTGNYSELGKKVEAELAARVQAPNTAYEKTQQAARVQAPNTAYEKVGQAKTVQAPNTAYEKTEQAARVIAPNTQYEKVQTVMKSAIFQKLVMEQGAALKTIAASGSGLEKVRQALDTYQKTNQAAETQKTSQAGN